MKFTEFIAMIAILSFFLIFSGFFWMANGYWQQHVIRDMVMGGNSWLGNIKLYLFEGVMSLFAGLIFAGVLSRFVRGLVGEVFWLSAGTGIGLTISGIGSIFILFILLVGGVFWVIVDFITWNIPIIVYLGVVGYFVLGAIATWFRKLLFVGG